MIPDHRATARLRWLRDELATLRRQLPLGARLFGGFEHGLMSATGALIAYLPTQVIGLREGFWAAITALAVVQTEFGATRTTARDQFTGAAIGGVVGLAALFVAGDHLATYAVAIVLSMMAAWLINVASAGRLAGITATIVLIVPHAGSTPERMMASRVLEVGWGITVAIAVVWAGARLRDALLPGAGRGEPTP